MFGKGTTDPNTERGIVVSALEDVLPELVELRDKLDTAVQLLDDNDIDYTLYDLS